MDFNASLLEIGRVMLEIDRVMRWEPRAVGGNTEESWGEGGGEGGVLPFKSNTRPS